MFAAEHPADRGAWYSDLGADPDRRNFSLPDCGIGRRLLQAEYLAEFLHRQDFALHIERIGGVLDCHGDTFRAGVNFPEWYT